MFKTGPWEDHPQLERMLCSVRGVCATDFHIYTMRALRNSGWEVQKEFFVAQLGRGGRVDIVATKDGVSLALELDNRSPRGKSIMKLGWIELPNLLTGVLLRNPR